MSKEAMKLALEALEKISRGGDPRWADDVLPTLREALAEQPAQQEPVANYCKECLTYNGHHEGCSHHTSPPAQRKPLPYNKDDMEGLDINQRLGFKLGWKSAEEAHGIKENK